MAILDLTNVIPIKCEGSYSALPGPLFPAPEVPPPSLVPTPLQLSVPHDMWIDMLPHGTMRDNAIRMMGTFDVDELCCDLVGGHFKGRNDLDLKGILVWSDPWCVSGWEVTEGFLKNWGFLLKGCWEVLAATNRWRGKRGDEPLVFEL
jgi:hypothetical protein